LVILDLPSSTPFDDCNDFKLRYLVYHAWEAEVWKDQHVEKSVCHMSSGTYYTEMLLFLISRYSLTLQIGFTAGWCEKILGFPVETVEVKCAALGHSRCEFLTAPAHKIHSVVKRHL